MKRILDWFKWPGKQRTKSSLEKAEETYQQSLDTQKAFLLEKMAEQNRYRLQAIKENIAQLEQGGRHFENMKLERYKPHKSYLER